MVTMYLTNAFLYAIICIPVYVIVRVIFVRKKCILLRIWREMLLLLFVFYAIAFLSLTVVPYWFLGDIDGEYFHIVLFSPRPINIIPFRSILSYFSPDSSLFLADRWQEFSMVNFLGNILLAIPLGIFLPTLWSRFRSFRNIALVGICVPLVIEMLQYFIGRIADIDDMLLNFCGVLIGFLLYKMLTRWKHRQL